MTERRELTGKTKRVPKATGKDKLNGGVITEAEAERGRAKREKFLKASKRSGFKFGEGSTPAWKKNQI